jgi:hypothetical protein
MMSMPMGMCIESGRSQTNALLSGMNKSLGSFIAKSTNLRTGSADYRLEFYRHKAELLAQMTVDKGLYRSGIPNGEYFHAVYPA